MKPENLLFDAEFDHVAIGDFGIAHFSEEHLATSVETRPHQRMANFQYAAPEQRTKGAPVDLRCDIYAMGLILNELFTGEVPFGTEFKAVESVVPELRYLDGIVHRMIAQQASSRPPSVDAVLQQLDAGSSAADFLAPVPPPADDEYTEDEARVLDYFVRKAAESGAQHVGTTGLHEELPGATADSVGDAVDLLGEDGMLDVEQIAGGRFLATLTAAGWFRRAAAAVGVDPRADATQILIALGDEAADGQLLSEKLGLDAARLTFALQSLEDAGYANVVTGTGGPHHGIHHARITAAGKKELRRVGPKKR